MSEIQEEIELLYDIQTSINQIESGNGIDHGDAKLEVLKRIKNKNSSKESRCS
jgi:antitoxin YefM